MYHPQGLRKLYSSYRSRCRKKRIAFELTTEEFTLLATMACYYCGVGPERELSEGFHCGTIDRVDHKGPYSSANCVPACWNCNRSKGMLTTWEFLNWAKRLVAYQSTKVIGNQ